MKTFLITTVLALGTAAPALANDQLALSLGLEPGQYTTAELATIRSALEGDDRQLAQFVIDRAAADGDVIGTQGSDVSAGHRQLAAALGVEPGRYTTAELVALRSAAEGNDQQLARAIEAGGAGSADVIGTQGTDISAGHRQIAASLGVDPADYSFSELARLKHSVED